VLARVEAARPSPEELAIYSLDWAPTLAAAKERAAKEKRPVFLVFVTNSFGNICSGHCWGNATQARSFLASPPIIDLLRPFVVTSAHTGRQDLSDVEPAAREIFRGSPLSVDPQRLNVFMFALDQGGQVVHGFHGLPPGRQGRAYYEAQIRTAREQLKVREGKAVEVKTLAGLPDLPTGAAPTPAGVRLLIRRGEGGGVPVVEVVPMAPAAWEPLAFSATARTIDAETLKPWLAQLYPPAIRAADAGKPFRTCSGALTLQPAGADGKTRYALLRGSFRLEKATQAESSLEGQLDAVVSYGSDKPEVQTVRGVVDGTYVYRARATTQVKLSAVIESRPE
jgi:hypothetical protein